MSQSHSSKIYIIYEVENLLSHKKFMGHYTGVDIPLDKVIIRHKNLISDIKIFGRANFIRKILYSLNSKEELLEKIRKIKDKDFFDQNVYNKNIFNKVPVQDKDGNNFLVYNTDERYLNGELFSVNKNKVNVKTKSGQIIQIDKEKYQSDKNKYKHINTGRAPKNKGIFKKRGKYKKTKKVEKPLIKKPRQKVKDTALMSLKQLEYWAKKRREIFPKFKKNILSKGRKYFIIKDFCVHGDLSIKQNHFRNIYDLNNEHYCEKCNEENIVISEIDFKKQRDIFAELNHKQSIYFQEEYLKIYYPILYKCVIKFNEGYDIKWKEKLYLFINDISSKTQCAIKNCNELVSFSPSNRKLNLTCSKHANLHYSSRGETEIYEFINQHFDNIIIRNYRKYARELDIYFPSLNIGIEFNGLFWHGDMNKDKKYHKDKLNIFKNHGISILNIWEDDWAYKKDIIKSIIRNKLNLAENKIYARKSIVKSISYKDAKIFLDNNHLQGSCISSINIGLYFNDELVSLMTFGKKRMILKSSSKNDEYELLRFCNKLNFSILGGASKLFSFFLKNYNPHKIISYSNNDISIGNLYKILKFECLGNTPLNFWWSDGNKKYHRSNFMKHKLVEQGYDKNKTATNIMKEKGYFRIWGTGNLKWEYINI